MINMLWKLIAWAVSRPRIADAIIARVQRTPYYHLPGYMHRWWLFNAYSTATSVEEGQQPETDPRNGLMRLLPSIRIHHILRADNDRFPHDHPWNARTIILRNGYTERRDNGVYLRLRGDTATLKYGEYHSIDYVPKAGVWTMFITGKRRGGWGFLVHGVKIPWREYHGVLEYMDAMDLAKRAREAYANERR